MDSKVITICSCCGKELNEKNLYFTVKNGFKNLIKINQKSNIICEKCFDKKFY